MNHSLNITEEYKDGHNHTRFKAVCDDCGTVFDYSPGSMKKINDQECPPSDNPKEVLWIRVSPEFKAELEKYRREKHFRFMNAFVIQCIREYIENHPMDSSEDKVDISHEIQCIIERHLAHLKGVEISDAVEES